MVQPAFSLSTLFLLLFFSTELLSFFRFLSRSHSLAEYHRSDQLVSRTACSASPTNLNFTTIPLWGNTGGDSNLELQRLSEPAHFSAPISAPVNGRVLPPSRWREKRGKQTQTGEDRSHLEELSVSQHIGLWNVEAQLHTTRPRYFGSTV